MQLEVFRVLSCQHNTGGLINFCYNSRGAVLAVVSSFGLQEHSAAASNEGSKDPGGSGGRWRPTREARFG